MFKHSIYGKKQSTMSIATIVWHYLQRPVVFKGDSCLINSQRHAACCCHERCIIRTGRCGCTVDASIGTTTSAEFVEPTHARLVLHAFAISESVPNTATSPGGFQANVLVLSCPSFLICKLIFGGTCAFDAQRTSCLPALLGRAQSDK